MKICTNSRCAHPSKPLSRFSKDKSRKDGLAAWCMDCNNEVTRRRVATQRDKVLKASRTYRESHNWTEYMRVYINTRRRMDPIFKLQQVMRSRLYSALRVTGFRKLSRTNKYIGCTTEKLKKHLEYSFEPGMAWHNHGKGSGKWNVDHIIPLSSATTAEELFKLCHYTNLQPLWENENMAKGDKLIWK